MANRGGELEGGGVGCEPGAEAVTEIIYEGSWAGS